MRVFSSAAAAVASMTLFALLLVLLSASTSLVNAAIGGDISEPAAQSAFDCARQKGWSFLIVRGYESLGRVDPNARESLTRAKIAGISHIDTYVFPDASQSPSVSVRATKNALGGLYGMMWLDVETGGSWSSNLESNCRWIAEWLSAARADGVHAGVYASEYEWSIVAGSGCTAGAEAGAPLWYPHYDGSRSFADFQHFGGWTKPSIKQYSDQTNVNCAISADANYYP